MKKKVYWLAVQPTPYNFYLFKQLKLSELFDFQICYSLKQQKNLPFDYKNISFKSDYFFKPILGIDFKILAMSLNRDAIFVIVGWENLTKFLFIAIRKILGLPYAFWTDSINPTSTLKSRNIFILKKWLLSSSNVVFTTGNFGVQKMLETGLFVDKNRLVSLPFFVEIPKDFKFKSFSVNKEPLNLLILSRIMQGKGIINSILAIEILVKEGYNVRLNIGGTGPDKEIIAELIADRNLSNFIHLLGWLDQEKLTNNRKSNHALLHAVDDHDPFPLVVLESMANALPIIGTKLAGSVSDRVIDGYNGIIVKHSTPEAIADSIKRLFQEGVIENLSVNSRKTAEDWPGSKGLEIVESAFADIKFNY